MQAIAELMGWTLTDLPQQKEIRQAVHRNYGSKNNHRAF
jgi:hypothetical protein